MGKLLESLRNLQSVERQLAQVRRRLKSCLNSVILRQRKVDQFRVDWDALHDKSMDRRKQSDELALDLRAKEEHVAKLRVSLNTAKTNKEYAAILTEINTFKADNAKVEDGALKLMQDIDAIKQQSDELQAKIDAEENLLQETRSSNAEEVTRLNSMIEDLTQKRDQAASEVDPEALVIFNRIVGTYNGEAMAAVEVHGRKPPFTYVCGGCYMSLNAEHANALRVRDEVRTCDNCGRILYMEPKGEDATIK